VVSYYTPFGFRSQGTDSSLKFQGEGSMFLKFYRSERGNKTEHYLYLSNEEDVKNAEQFFPILPYVLGVESPHERYPIIFLNDSTYGSVVNEWSSGRYRTGGLILVKNSTSSGDMPSLIIHETAHGFNSKLLGWDGTDSVYFDEGVAKFAEFLVKRKRDIPQAEIFGDRTQFRKGGRRYYYESRSSPEVLWNYYRKNKGWMKSWTPWEDVDRGAREFGYAYSELLVRDYVRRNGLLSMRNVSRELLKIDGRVQSTHEKREIFSRVLGTFRPCYSDDREKFGACLDRINEQDFELEDLEINTTYRKKEDVNITPDFRLPERGSYTTVDKLLETPLNFLESIMEMIPWI